MMATQSPAKRSLLDASKPKRPKDARFFVIVPLILCGLCTAIVPFGSKIPLFAELFGAASHVAGQLTVTAKGDGTLEVDEIPEYWFGPTAIGSALNYAMIKHFGENAKPEEVNVIIKADAGASDATIRTAITDARAHGFLRFGFTDSRLSELAKQSANAASMRQPPQRGKR